MEKNAAINAIFTNVNNWETIENKGILPAVAPGEKDTIYFLGNPIADRISGNAICKDIVFEATHTIIFSGTFSIYGSFTSNGNMYISSNTFIGSSKKIGGENLSLYSKIM